VLRPVRMSNVEQRLETTSPVRLHCRTQLERDSARYTRESDALHRDRCQVQSAQPRRPVEWTPLLP
jgi:hypothetical protein